MIYTVVCSCPIIGVFINYLVTIVPLFHRVILLAHRIAEGLDFLFRLFRFTFDLICYNLMSKASIF